MNRPPHTPTPRRGQRGAALLMAMIIVSLVATLAVGMVWQQWQAVQVEAAERSQAQARWILNGALDWARLILREDARAALGVMGEGGVIDLSQPANPETGWRSDCAAAATSRHRW